VPFTLDTKISDALQERPALRQLLPAFHPAFNKLNHPVLGRIMPRLVDVRGAARVAGVDAAALLAVMNLPGPPPPGTVLPAGVRSDEPTPAWLQGGSPLRLDVRPQLAAGEDPFALIMGGLRSLSAGQALTVEAPFEPAPLRALLGGRGWESHVRWDGETCLASFWRPPDLSGANAEDDETPTLAERLQVVSGGFEIDVSDLAPPAPLRLALMAIDADHLPLTMRHRREPALLYPQLEQRGLEWSVSEQDGLYFIRVTRKLG
jgi:uncharacterized protein (DUF2249 family)